MWDTVQHCPYYQVFIFINIKDSDNNTTQFGTHCILSNSEMCHKSVWWCSWKYAISNEMINVKKSLTIWRREMVLIIKGHISNKPKLKITYLISLHLTVLMLYRRYRPTNIFIAHSLPNLYLLLIPTKKFNSSHTSLRKSISVFHFKDLTHTQLLATPEDLLV